MSKFNQKVGFALLASVLGTSMMAGSILAAPLSPVNHVDWLVKKNVITESKTGDYQLDKNISLAEAITTFARANGATVTPVKGAHWSAPYINWAISKGALSDKQSKTPMAPISAAELNEIGKKLGVALELAEAKHVTRGNFFAALGDALTTQVTIGHVNDVHGHIEDNPTGKEYGYAKMNTLVKEWRAENPNFLLLDAGDTFQGTIFVNQMKGESILPILNHMGFNAMAAGNHEFDFGYQQLLKLRDGLKYPLLSANIFTQDNKQLLVPTYKVEIDGKKFVFFSMTAEDTPILTHPDNVKGLAFKNPIEIAKSVVPELKKEADHVILLSHVGVDVDREIAKNVTGIDLIIGGHSHTQIKEPELVNGTYIVQDWEYGKSIGRADLFYYKNELVTFSGGIAEYDEKVQADPEVDAMVKDIVKKVDDSMNVVIAKSEVDLDGDRALVRTRETNVGNLIADIMLARTKSIKGHEADVALTNAGGIRTQLKAGDITKKGLYTLLPFPNTLTVVEVTGEELKQALESGVSEVEKGAGRFPQVSGMSFSYDPAQPAGQRVIEVKIGDKPLDLAKTYKVATNDFIASGGDGYASLKKANAFNTGLTLYSVVEEALIQQKVVKPQVEKRIVEVKK